MEAIYLLPFLLASVLGDASHMYMQIPRVAVAPTGLTYSNVAPGALTYSNLNLNIPAPIPAGEAPSPDVLVQRTPVQALGRPVVRYTPQITEVRPQLKITDRTYNVPVRRPVYETKEVTPIQHRYVPEPYTVQQPYAVAQPYAVPTPVRVPVHVAQPVHVQHNVIAQPALTYAAAAAPAGLQTYAATNVINPLTYNAAFHHGAPFLGHGTFVQKVEVDDD